ncbi:diguanylate cyclase (GGDEF)-like protein [Kineococcus radiotolerans]|uniref:Diguanylate cyclase (GGDEF)-like protein n=1 Tax=Kineococcus radiotolerans TaxID=131568 RepID=A0A7W4TQE4_KINRA|nr:EAL domain-containing protein [Kineococcus radiotolerans]MBB2903194.1 diguanylate cyclase (GGDEF)-like protein [Kineococcus radiotolerans]
MRSLREAARRHAGLAFSVLPRGRMLPDEVWQRRHRAIVRVAGLQALVLVLFGAFSAQGVAASLAGGLLVAAPLLLALPPSSSRKLRSGAASVSLFLASTVLVQFWSGQTEAHFHFFVMVGLVALYQDWVPFSVGLLIVVVHHGLLGTLFPGEVYDHHAAMTHPWRWMVIHAGFVLAASATHLTSWRLNEQQGLRDALTGLANRTQLSEFLTRVLSRRDQVGVLFVDLDDFKNVNDSRGHAAGDQLLLAVAERLRACVRGSDLVARLGGDEFAVVIHGGAAPARRVGERFLASLAQPVDVDGQPLHVHASLGTADTATLCGTLSELDTATELLRNADLAMYWAKAAGKNRLVAYSPGMSQAAHDKASLREDLAHALDAGQLEVHYQATVDFRKDNGLAQPKGYEALLRWHHPERGTVPPLEFIPLAEASGDILAIGAWVLRTATAQAATWSTERGYPVSVAVNLSAVQLASDDILHTVREALRENDLRPHQLTLEVTESVLVDDLEAVSARLAQLRAAGVLVAIDDFGTGYSSLSYLRRLPVDTVKIDRSFVTDLAHGGSATTLVASIIELARSLGLDVVAEGVETEQQAQVLRELSCTYAQGYLYARPQPAREVASHVPDHVTSRATDHVAGRAADRVTGSVPSQATGQVSDAGGATAAAVSPSRVL